jgi:hypothetical protein
VTCDIDYQPELRRSAEVEIPKSVGVLVPSRVGNSTAGDERVGAFGEELGEGHGVAGCVGVGQRWGDQGRVPGDGGSLSKALIGPAASTPFGWITSWNAAVVPNRAFTLTSIAFDAAGNSTTSTGVAVTVTN